jgi:hypothetical protein
MWLMIQGTDGILWPHWHGFRPFPMLEMNTRMDRKCGTGHEQSNLYTN